MPRSRTGSSPAAALSLLAVAALALSACSGGAAPGSAAGGKTLVIDTSFNLKTADPGREYERTGQIVDKALYQTLLTFKGGDVTRPVPELAAR